MVRSVPEYGPWCRRSLSLRVPHPKKWMFVARCIGFVGVLRLKSLPRISGDKLLPRITPWKRYNSMGSVSYLFLRQIINNGLGARKCDALNCHAMTDDRRQETVRRRRGSSSNGATASLARPARRTTPHACTRKYAKKCGIMERLSHVTLAALPREKKTYPFMGKEVRKAAATTGKGTASRIVSGSPRGISEDTKEPRGHCSRKAKQGSITPTPSHQSRSSMCYLISGCPLYSHPY
ncbi:hypothetical protein E2C01_067745 [Portunus trituberculatus]|uniref:Uncharacterized protein n=1 Tax=Portunus trituberculatus TaxID=210409 RepID=A0A5B7HVY0_PORTR|nr:hypothetical protein [Portunus trituberculatus]